MLQKPLRGIPDHMEPWNLRLEQMEPTEHGKFAVVDIQPSPIEQNHIVRVIDEEGRDLTGICVVFGFPGGGGRQYNLKYKENWWWRAPVVINGNVQYTLVGLAQHTVGDGGEDIWVHNIEPNGNLELSSDIVRNCTRVAGRNQHECVFITFQRQRAGATTLEDRVSKLEGQLTALTACVMDLTETVEAHD